MSERFVRNNAANPMKPIPLPKQVPAKRALAKLPGRKIFLFPTLSSYVFSPKSPVGLMIKTMAMSRKANTMAKRGINRMPKDESCPMRNEATIAPSRLPSPPVTVTTKQSTKISRAMPG